VKFLRPTHPYIKVQGRWCYLYRAIDRSGALIDVRLSETRDMGGCESILSIAQNSNRRHCAPHLGSGL